MCQSGGWRKVLRGLPQDIDEVERRRDQICEGFEQSEAAFR